MTKCITKSSFKQFIINIITTKNNWKITILFRIMLYLHKAVI